MGETSTFFRHLAYAVIAIVVLSALFLGLVYGGLLAKPAFLEVEREAYTSSYQYTEARESELIKLVDEYNDLDTQVAKYVAANSSDYDKVIENLEIQQEFIVDEIYETADNVDDINELPKSVRDFMRKHPRD